MKNKLNTGLVYAALFILSIAAGMIAFYSLIITGIELLKVFAPAGIFLIAVACFALFSGAIITLKKLYQ